MPNSTQNTNYSYVLAIIASIGGLLFGFNAGIISGALPFLKNSWGGLSANQSDQIVISTLIGATIGALLSINFSNKYGRRALLVASSIIYTIGAVFSGAAMSVSFLLISRLILGIAMGISSCIVPMYISEISPKNNRGALVSVFQLMITIGILLSFISYNIIADEFNPFSWRKMFYLGTLPSILFFVGTFFLPETPWYLAYKKQAKSGHDLLKRLDPSEKFENIIHAIENNMNKPVWNSGLKHMLLVVIGIMFFQQFVGINTIIYFTPTLLSGIPGENSALNLTFSIGVINVLSSVLAIVLVDRIGRRKLFFIGLYGMAAALIILAAVFYSGMALNLKFQWFIMFIVLIYIMFFAISLGPLSWLIFSEVFSFKSKGLGMGIGAFSNWLFNAVLTIIILKFTWVFTQNNGDNTLKQSMDNYGLMFLFFAIIAIVAILWGNKKLPETKGVSLYKNTIY